jgi:hypothetical protein
MAIEFDAPLLRWGNSYALRITRAQAETLGARPGVPLHARVEAAGRPTWNIPVIRGDGPSDWSVRHDEILEEAIEEEWQSWQGS